MRRQTVLLVAVMAGAAMALSCRSPKEQLSKSVKTELAAFQSEKSLIDDKLQEIERARSVLEQRNREELENIRRALESIQNAQNKIQARLDALETAQPTVASPPKRLGLPLSIALSVICIFCFLIALKLVHMRRRQKGQIPTPEAPGESSAGSSPSGTPS
jgi:uncharacterized protein YhaN